MASQSEIEEERKNEELAQTIRKRAGELFRNLKSNLDKPFTGPDDQRYNGPDDRLYSGPDDRSHSGPDDRSYRKPLDRAYSGPEDRSFSKRLDRILVGPETAQKMKEVHEKRVEEFRDRQETGRPSMMDRFVSFASGDSRRARNAEFPGDHLRHMMSKSRNPAEILACRVADQAMSMSDRDVVRQVPGIYQAMGTTTLPRDREARWSAIALSMKDYTEEFIMQGKGFRNVPGEEMPGRPASLPREVAPHARARAVLETARSWEPGQRVEHSLHTDLERVSWRTSKMFAYGEKHEADVARQAREMEMDDKQISARMAPISRYHDQEIPQDPQKKREWLREGLSTEYAAVRSGMTGPRHAVDMAMRPEFDRLEKDREPDNMMRIVPNYEKGARANESPEKQAEMLSMTRSTLDRPIPAAVTQLQESARSAPVVERPTPAPKRSMEPSMMQQVAQGLGR